MTKVVFVGNCQAEALFFAYARWVAPERGETVQYVPAYAEADAAAREAIRQADLIALQITDIAQEVSLAEFETNARLVMFPHVTAAFLWPFQGGKHPRSTEIPPAHNTMFVGEYSDRWLNKRLARGEDPQAVLERYRGPGIVAEADLDRLIELVSMHQQKRDALCDTRMGDYIMANLGSNRLFIHKNHPSLELFALMLRQIFSRMGCGSADIDWAIAHYRETPFPAAQVPIHPRVAEHLGLNWVSDDLKYRLPLFADHVTWEQYCQRYVTLEWNEPMQRCLALAGQHLPRTELETLTAELETASARYDSADGYFALCDIRRRLGDLTGSIAAIQRARSLEPLWWHYAARHAQVLIAAGDFEQALAIAEDVVTFYPQTADGRMTLSEAYHALGRKAEALQEARAALAAAPGHPHMLKRLAQLESEYTGTPYVVARDGSAAVGAE